MPRRAHHHHAGAVPGEGELGIAALHEAACAVLRVLVWAGPGVEPSIAAFSAAACAVLRVLGWAGPHGLAWESMCCMRWGGLELG
eukprot:366331-Chlamydomonas_euryale.AAC.32